MLSHRLRMGVKSSLYRPINCSVHQFAKSGFNPRTTILATNLNNNMNLETLKQSVKEIKEIIGVELQPGCSLHYVNAEEAEKAVASLTKANFAVSFFVVRYFVCRETFYYLVVDYRVGENRPSVSSCRRVRCPPFSFRLAAAFAAHRAPIIRECSRSNSSISNYISPTIYPSSRFSVAERCK